MTYLICANAIRTNTNNLTTPSSFATLTIADNGYTIGGNEIALAGGINALQAAGSDTVNLPISLGGNATVNVNQAGASLVLGGAISGPVGLTKVSAGLLDLTGANTYSGTTAINGGTLFVDTAQGGSPVTIGANATLGGSGTVGTITSNSGIVTPGKPSPTILTDVGDLDLGTGSTFTDSINGATAGSGGYGQLVVAGQVTLDGATLNATAGFTPTVGDQFTIIDNTGSSSVVGTFNGLPEGSMVTISSKPFRISYAGGDGNDVVLTALADSTTTVMTSSDAVTFGQSVTLSATVASSDMSISGPPTGVVEFFNGSTSLGTATLSGGGATLPAMVLPAGSYSITAHYQGDNTFATSTSSPISVAVAQALTTTTASANPTTPVSGQPVTFTATVAAVSPGSGTPTGSVQFFNGTTSLGTATLSNGVATLSNSALPVGTNSINASYTASTSFLASTSSAVVQTVGLGNATVSLNVSKPDPVAAESVLFTATVAAGTGTGTPTGTVDFFANGALLGTSTLTSGQATLITALDLGHQTITAVYSGDSNFSSTTSSTLSLIAGDNNDLFLNQVYLDLFQSPIDLPGLVAWRTMLVNGTPRNQVVSFIITTPGVVTSKISLTERILGPQKASQDRGHNSALVNDLYGAILGRQPTAKELRQAVKTVRPPGGVKQLVVKLFSSGEFYRNAFVKP